MRYSKLSKKQRRKLMELFVAGATARTAAAIVGVNKNTAQLFFHRVREVIAEKQDSTLVFEGEVEADESYFGGKRKGKRGRGAAGKVPVFGLLKRGGKVFAETISDVKGKTLVPIIKEKVVPDSIVYTYSLPSYNALDVSEFKHMRINHSKLFAEKHNHINGIENFWNQAKRHMRKFNGVPKKNFRLFLKECEWRFNFPSPKQQLDMLIKWIEANK
ncbi:MAG: IS1595 family transposase [Candidatus Babeliaceae bacterium]|nr:IS1595 family transposase [Candidatus Babeliaceae bacterium]